MVLSDPCADDQIRRLSHRFQIFQIHGKPIVPSGGIQIYVPLGVQGEISVDPLLCQAICTFCIAVGEDPSSPLHIVLHPISEMKAVQTLPDVLFQLCIIQRDLPGRRSKLRRFGFIPGRTFRCGFCRFHFSPTILHRLPVGK
jgi:hypothetical protein